MNDQPRGHTVYLSLGSNVGDRLEYLKKAVEQLKKTTTVKAVSSVYETAAVGNTGQNDFLNLCLQLETVLSPHALMRMLLKIERRLGRRRAAKWGPRNIDMDIIFFDDVILHDEGLCIPHTRYAERNFVLVPLAEIAGEWICPLRKMRLKEILKNSADRHAVRKSETGLLH